MPCISLQYYLPSYPILILYCINFPWEGDIFSSACYLLNHICNKILSTRIMSRHSFSPIIQSSSSVILSLQMSFTPIALYSSMYVMSYPSCLRRGNLSVDYYSIVSLIFLSHKCLVQTWISNVIIQVHTSTLLLWY